MYGQIGTDALQNQTVYPPISKA